MKKVAELKLNADTETLNRSEMTHEELENAQVGHAWVSLTCDNARAAPASLGQPTKGLVKAGGTAMKGLGVCFPNALYRDLYQLQKKGDAAVTTKSLDAGERHE